MTSRERYHAAINHEEPDRVPIDVGQDFHNGIHEAAYKNLLNHLGETDEIVIYDQMQHLVVCKESILKRLRADTRYIFSGPAEGFELIIEDDTSWLDEWGVRRRTCGYYDENVDPPLKNCTMEKIRNFKVPNPSDPARFKGLREKALKLQKETDYAVIGGNPASLFFLSSEFTGFQEYMEKIITEREMIEALIDIVLKWQIEFYDKYLDEIGDITEVVWMGDDWGTQIGPIMNPKTFREIFKPRYRELTRFIKSKTNAKIALHTCGSVLWVLEDLIEAGFEIVHPLQGDAEEMKNPKEIKARFGDRLAFYSNLKNQSTIPHGTPEDVREDVKNKIRDLAPGGGYILSGGHNIQADVPPENILALFDAGHEYGSYPIQV